MVVVAWCTLRVDGALWFEMTGFVNLGALGGGRVSRE